MRHPGKLSKEEFEGIGFTTLQEALVNFSYLYITLCSWSLKASNWSFKTIGIPSDQMDLKLDWLSVQAHLSEAAFIKHEELCVTTGRKKSRGRQQSLRKKERNCLRKLQLLLSFFQRASLETRQRKNMLKNWLNKLKIPD